MNDNLQLINTILVVAINLIGIWLVFLVYFSDKTKALNRGFVLLLLPNLLWVDFYILASFANEYDLSLLFTRLTFAFAAIFFISFYYFFIVWFLDERGRYLILGKLILIYETVFSLLCVFTNLILPSIEIGKFGIIPLFSNFGKVTFYFSVIFLVILVIGRLVIMYFKSPQNIKHKIQYFLLGVCIFTISNFIIGVILPTFFKVHDYYFITNYSTFFLLTFTAYAIVKQELMGIKALLVQVLIAAISIILLIDILFLSNSPVIQLLKIGILLFFLYFSRELINNIKKEREARKELEMAYEKISQYASEIENNNNNLANKNEDLGALLSLSQMSFSGADIEKNIQDILNIVPAKLGHLKIIGAILVRYDENSKKAYGYLTTESEVLQKARSMLAKKSLREYYIFVDKDNSYNSNLTAKAILDNKIEKSKNFTNFISPPVDRITAWLIQKRFGIKAAVSVPITMHDRKLGALIFMLSKPLDKIDQRDLGLTTAFTQHVGVVLENLQFYESLNENITELTKTKNNLEEAISMKNDFLHIVSHQLRTPLTAVRGFVYMWRDGDFDNLSFGKLKEIRKRVADNIDRLNNIVNDMIIAMESQGSMKLIFAPTNVETLIKENIEMLKSGFEKKGLYVKYQKTSGDIPLIEADGKYLRHVFMNLIDNAAKYTERGGLEITLRQEKNTVYVRFVDTGIGISDGDKILLFKKFSRGKNSSRINPGGSGLGLFISKQILDEHRGKLQLSSLGDGKGSTFVVELPVRQPVVVGGTAEMRAGKGNSKLEIIEH